uniref:Uncharacterized protein n=1 Tax=Anopheles coluzzii TaxID=1518534 RepID=A0A8W7PMM6_ANOCL
MLSIGFSVADSNALPSSPGETVYTGTSGRLVVGVVVVVVVVVAGGLATGLSTKLPPDCWGREGGRGVVSTVLVVVIGQQTPGTNRLLKQTSDSTVDVARVGSSVLDDTITSDAEVTALTVSCSPPPVPTRLISGSNDLVMFCPRTVFVRVSSASGTVSFVPGSTCVMALASCPLGIRNWATVTRVGVDGSLHGFVCLLRGGQTSAAGHHTVAMFCKTRYDECPTSLSQISWSLGSSSSTNGSERNNFTYNL